MASLKIGVLAIQGGFSKHAEAIKALNAEPVYVRRPIDLERCDALIIPGGESTVISKGINFIGLREPVLAFAAQKPLFGTCAGLIMMAKPAGDAGVESFGILDAEVVRNGYGSQYESFSTDIAAENLKELPAPIHAIFIRAPRIISTGPNVEVLASFNHEPILIRQGHHMAASFHPELANNLQIHHVFLKKVRRI